jgi:hypothetical protein
MQKKFLMDWRQPGIHQKGANEKAQEIGAKTGMPYLFDD